MAVVEFVADVYPYCKGDVVDLSESDLKAVDVAAKKRDVTAYKSVGKKEAKQAGAVEQPTKPSSKK